MMVLMRMAMDQVTFPRITSLGSANEQGLISFGYGFLAFISDSQVIFGSLVFNAFWEDGWTVSIKNLSGKD